MDKKITRRAVLGTIVGGLVVAPFVLRSRWKREGMTDTFAEWWRQRLLATDVKIEKLSRASVDVEHQGSFVFAAGTNYVGIAGFYQDSSFPATTPVSLSELVAAVPDRFLFREGSFNTVSEGKNLFLSGNVRTALLVVPGHEQKLPTGDWRINLEKLSRGDVSQDERERVPIGACIELPVQRTLGAGVEWQGANPFGNAGSSLVNYRVVELVSVNGVDAVKAEFRFSDVAVSKNDVNQQRIAERLRTKGYSQSDADRIAAQLAGELVAEISKTELKSVFDGIVYVDFRTGQVLRHQLHIATATSGGVQHSVGVYHVS